MQGPCIYSINATGTWSACKPWDCQQCRRTIKIDFWNNIFEGWSWCSWGRGFAVKAGGQWCTSWMILWRILSGSDANSIKIGYVSLWIHSKPSGKYFDYNDRLHVQRIIATKMPTDVSTSPGYLVIGLSTTKIIVWWHSLTVTYFVNIYVQRWPLKCCLTRLSRPWFPVSCVSTQVPPGHIFLHGHSKCLQKCFSKFRKLA